LAIFLEKQFCEKQIILDPKNITGQDEDELKVKKYIKLLVMKKRTYGKMMSKQLSKTFPITFGFHLKLRISDSLI